MLSARITHRHPEGIAGAVVQAMAVGIATRWSLEGRPLDRQAFLEEVLGHCSPLPEDFASELKKVSQLPEVDDSSEGAELLAEIFPLDVTARGSVPAALSAFLMARGFEEAIVMAVRDYGG